MSPRRALGPRRPLAAQPLDAPVLGARRDPDRLRSVQRRHLDRRPLDRLGDRYRQVDLEVAVGALAEHRRGRDPGGHVEVAARPAAVAGLALAGEPDPAAVVDSGGNVDPVALGLLGDPAAAAGRAGLLDHAAAPAALGAGLGDREEPLALGVDPASAAARADLAARSPAWRRCRAQVAQAPVVGTETAIWAPCIAWSKLRLHLGLEVAPALAARGPLLPLRLNKVEKMSPRSEAKPPPGNPPGAARAAAEAAESAARVVLPALFGIRERVVGLLDLLEALLGLAVVGVPVGVPFARQRAVGLLDLLVGGPPATPSTS